MKYLRKARIKSNHHGLCRLGYTFATMGIINKRLKVLKQIFKDSLSSDYYLQLDSMKSESLVIANHASCGEIGTGALYIPPVTVWRMSGFKLGTWPQSPSLRIVVNN